MHRCAPKAAHLYQMDAAAQRRFLYEPMRPGARIPGIKGGTLATDPCGLREALPRIRRAFERLESEAPTTPHPALGPLNHEDWVAINVRRAELHLGFFVPE
jgi:hypothetical protein